MKDAVVHLWPPTEVGTMVVSETTVSNIAYDATLEVHWGEVAFILTEPGSSNSKRVCYRINVSGQAVSRIGSVHAALVQEASAKLRKEAFDDGGS